VNAKVLIVEDSLTTRAVIKVYLVGRRLELLEANDGETGFQLARQHLPNVIVADLKMPGMDGFTFCRRVRGDPRLRATPLIVLTGVKGEEVRQEAMLAGASHFMNKPIDGAALAQLIVACLDVKK
jgi:two-component system chemotaxis response regulator CheY